MKFKTKKDSETGKKIEDLFNRMKETNEESKKVFKDIVTNYNIKAKTFVFSNYYIAGGLSMFCFNKFEDIPDYFISPKKIEDILFLDLKEIIN